MSPSQYAYWKHTQLIIDVVPGLGGMFSLENGEGVRFLTRSRLFDEAEVDVAAVPAAPPPPQTPPASANPSAAAAHRWTQRCDPLPRLAFVMNPPNCAIPLPAMPGENPIGGLLEAFSRSAAALHEAATEPCALARTVIRTTPATPLS